VIHIVGRRDAAKRLGGDALQIDETAQVLRDAGHLARVHTTSDFTPDPGDVVHLHNIQRVHDWEDLPERARAAGADIVITPLYHPTDDYHRRGRRGLDAGIARLLPDADVFAGLRWGRSGLKERAAEVLALAKRLLLVHEGEGGLLDRDFGATGTPTSVVPVAIPAVPPSPDVSANLDLPTEPFIACVGRIEPLKNSAAVLDVARQINAPVVFAGPFAGPRHAGYVARFRAAVATSKMATHLGEVSREEVLQLLRRAHVHVLASWTEVVGRATLEAAASGAATVFTDVGFAPTYLAGTSALAVSPGDPDALRLALETALGVPRPGPTGVLAQRVRDRYTWNVVGPALVAGVTG
jgi:glycosyltransferase involved in cell wall biosynthesis